MRQHFDLLVFDWDGTLSDSAGHIVNALQASFRDLELPVPDEASARYVIGLGLHDALSYLDPALPADRYHQVSERYRHHFLAGDADIKLFPRVNEGIAELEARGYLLGVATGKSRRGLDLVLQSTQLGRHFHASRCADEGLPKPHPDMLETLIDALGAKPERTLMIGDTTHDLQMARNAGVAAVAVSYGAHPLADLERLGPLACFGSFGSLMQWLRQDG